jgi:uncharacterized protein YndB with AHSA1/START domain
VPEPQPEAVVRRVLPAPPGVVYDEWLDPRAMADWMCPRPARCLGIESEPRVGGQLRIDIEENGVRFYVSGQYLALDRPGLLRFTWSCSTWPDPSVSSIVTVLLAAHEQAGTLMTIRHTLLPGGLAAQHQRGWAAIGAQLAGVLAAGRPAG